MTSINPGSYFAGFKSRLKILGAAKLFRNIRESYSLISAEHSLFVQRSSTTTKSREMSGM